ncbi:formate dehydrogenase accessory sulfurtransferase FdhD [Brachybacterium huguangmaarense]|uniref:Sulfur carrier protein FdhD n=1 Tax=Brachybacterium huguangmaarense TaxID=1652028 RepID=A0ABY6G3Y5_9MICO|nr:formate dehydrogenase accessory sulfurtransferase FdhD [Brachybacterium huguangmaarense]UYG17341.1 formate dehydrogenase accessory sulfurtransferase FdhD [Brachybacterium huguangmaarense]
MGRVTDARRITTVRIRDGRLYAGRKGDHVAVEEPLDIRLNGQRLSMTMRTPGHDVELIHGFLHAEGYIAGREDVGEARYCDGAVIQGETGLPENNYNVMDVATRIRPLAPIAIRNVVTNSACGVCGSTSIDEVQTQGRYTLGHDWTIAPQTLFAAQQRFDAGQVMFQRTGGIHGAALIAPDGEILVQREDVGRHNAVDKVIGWALLHDRLPAADCLLLVSSRASFEIAQKAYMAGIPFLACVSAASSLAIETAERVGMTLVGFLRGRDDGDGRMNVYTGPERLDLSDAA